MWAFKPPLVEAGDGGGRRWWCQALEVPSIAHANGPSILYNLSKPFQVLCSKRLVRWPFHVQAKGATFSWFLCPQRLEEC